MKLREILDSNRYFVLDARNFSTLIKQASTYCAMAPKIEYSLSLTLVHSLASVQILAFLTAKLSR